MITLLLVIICISLLILVHEWGHFYSARKLGVRVDEFGFGFPPKVFSFVKNGVRYSLNALPLGGFVKIYGEHGEGEHSTESFAGRPVWQRLCILAAGVFMNLVLAWVFFSVASALGVPKIADSMAQNIPVSIVTVVSGSPAEQAGLKFGDQVLEMRSDDLSLRIEKEFDVQDFTQAYRGEEIIMVVRRGDEIREVKVTPRGHVPEGEGPLGISLAKLEVEHAPWYLAPYEGAKALVRTVVATLAGFAFLIKELVMNGAQNVPVSGPVGIFFFAEDSRSLGASFFLQFIGILSVNLAILNFLPIPALDGGRIFFLVIEKIRRKRIDPSVENIVHTIGFFILITLMVFITYKDIIRIF